MSYLLGVPVLSLLYHTDLTNMHAQRQDKERETL